MAYYPFAQHLGDRYVLTAPNGSTAVFNDSTDPNYVGVLTEVTGLDSADIREVADDLVQQDGGQHGDFWMSRRPITLNGLIYNHASIRERDLKVDRLMRGSMALRGDATLSWKPITRQENMVANPKAVVDTAGHGGATSGSPTRLSGNYPPGFTSGFVYNTAGGGSTWSGYIGLTGNGTGTAGIPVIPGKLYTASLMVNTVSLVGATWTNTALLIRWYDSTGTFISDSAGYSGNPVMNSYRQQTASAYAPANAAYASIKFLETWSATPTNFVLRYSGVRFTEGSDTTYFDGDVAGAYWQGNPGTSPSGDFIEMYTLVRRQQPLRVTGGWNKEFQLQMVSEWATLFSTQQLSSVGSGVTVENRGSYPAFARFRVTGPSTNPTVAVTGAGAGTLKTTGLTIASGAWVDFDMFTHTAISNTGVSMNRYIDFANTTSWPVLNSGNNTVTLTGGGTLTTFWRDTWA